MMMLPVWLFAIPLTVISIGWWLNLGHSDYDALSDSVAPVIIGAVVSLAALMFLIGGLVVSLSRHYGRISCRTFAAQTHRPTRFVVYTSWDSGDCLTRTAGGKWIPTKNLREFGEKP